MIDLKKSDGGELIHSELRELSTTNHQLRNELDITRQKLTGELDTLTYRLDRLTYELKNGEKSVRLANKEFQMLEMLMQNPGAIISAETFMDKIWGWDSDSELNVVWVYVSYVRKKLQNVEADVKITAVRNVGYTLEKQV